MYYRVSNGGTMKVTNVSRSISSTTEGVSQKTFTLNVGAGYNAVYISSISTYNYGEGDTRSCSFSYNKSNGNVTITFNTGNKAMTSFQATIVFACIKV